MEVELIDLFQAEQMLKDINSFDKSLAEKLSLIEQLDKKDKLAFDAVLDTLPASREKVSSHDLLRKV